ncbi:hypothetical protein BIW11_02851 [Tropilaelaps mercedesae]|uniref:Uncharacterized protein n=1 Tax=Tropilaelaps mercedesae TaxID=418985 RepID=A0A1V9XWE4_9ACAR|nr:hypothetical protein BIW11_02851 [Tropilaelaps mercedesae]
MTKTSYAWPRFFKNYRTNFDHTRLSRRQFSLIGLKKKLLNQRESTYMVLWVEAKQC